MKFRHLFLVLPLSIACGWWLHSRQQAPEVEGSLTREPARQFKIGSVARKPVAVAQAEEVRPSLQSAQDYISQLQRLRACENEQCSYPQTDPRSYDFALGKDIQKTLFRFAEWVRSHALESREVSETAVQFLQFEDGHVQSAALDLMSTQPTSLENRDAILKSVIEGHDSELIEQAMLELERYTSALDRDVINQALGRALTVGAPFVARAIVNHIAPFVDARSFRLFQDVLTHLPPESIYFEKLEASLNAFRTASTEG